MNLIVFTNTKQRKVLKVIFSYKFHKLYMIPCTLEFIKQANY